MDDDTAREKRAVLDLDVSGERAVVADDDVRAEPAIVRHVRPDHDVVIIAQNCDGLRRRAPADARVLAKDVAAADPEVRALAGEVPVFGVVAEDDARIEMIVFADRRIPLDDDMGIEARAGTDLDVLLDQAERAHRSGLGNPGPLAHDGGIGNRHEILAFPKPGGIPKNTTSRSEEGERRGSLLIQVEPWKSCVKQ